MAQALRVFEFSWLALFVIFVSSWRF